MRRKLRKQHLTGRKDTTSHPLLVHSSSAAAVDGESTRCKVRGGAARERKRGEGRRQTLSGRRFVRAAAGGRGRRQEERGRRKEEGGIRARETVWLRTGRIQTHREGESERRRYTQREKRRFPLLTSLTHERSHAGANSRSRASRNAGPADLSAAA
ncbi:unnamed protein product [Pleuronectes platessa]|uniref:Uncharacterized protein n=1 Tax=Pleuronectes platessa TaxID=8262 RepID=A0A9N7TME1_PLEPL|nr:unnamed protein product [Pleuronectes platessa]